MGRLEFPLGPAGLSMQLNGIRSDLSGGPLVGILAADGQRRQGQDTQRQGGAEDESRFSFFGVHGLARVDSNHHRRFQRPVSCH